MVMRDSSIVETITEMSPVSTTAALRKCQQPSASGGSISYSLGSEPEGPYASQKVPLPDPHTSASTLRATAPAGKSAASRAYVTHSASWLSAVVTRVRLSALASRLELSVFW